MTLTAATVVLIALAIVVGATLQRVSGLGMGLVVAPMLAVVLGAAPVVLVGLGTGWLVDHLGRLPHVRRWWVTPGAGLLGGALNTIAGVAGPVMIVHSRLVRWGQADFAATMQPVFMVMGALSVLAKTVATPFTVWVPPWWLGAVVVGGVLAGIALGGYLVARVSAGAARRTATILAALGGAAALVRGLVMLG